MATDSLLSFTQYWLGWQDSNLRMPGSKPGALPLGDTPIFKFPNVDPN
jgi:hypothetical protein